MASANNPEFSARIVRESTAMATLNHPPLSVTYPVTGGSDAGNINKTVITGEKVAQ